MQEKLTPKFLDGLKPATGKRYEVRDTLLVGLLVRVSKRGSKVWYATPRVNGRPKRVKIGNYPVVSLADAREKSREILNAAQLGKFDEPVAETETVPTLGEVIPQFVELYADSQEWEFRLKSLDSGKFLKDKRGTEITVKNLHEEPREHFGQEWFLEKLRRQIRVAQQHFMRNSLVIKFNGKPIPAELWKLKSAKELQPFSKTYTDRIRKGKVSTRIFAGVGDSNPTEAGWYIFCNGRCVLERDQSPVTGWGKRFQGDDGSTNPKFHNQFSRFRGYAFLDSDDASLVPWDSTKAALDEGSISFRLLRGRLVEAMRGVIDFLNELDAQQDMDEKERTITRMVRAAPLKAIDDLGKNTEFKFVPSKPSGPTFVDISYRKPQTEIHDLKEKLSPVDGFDQDKGGGETYEREEVPLGLLAA